MGSWLNQSMALCGAVACACSVARPTVMVQPVFELENTVFLTEAGAGTMTVDGRFAEPGRWISRPPAAMQSPIPAPPVLPESRVGGGPSYGIGEPGWSVNRPEPTGGPGGGDPGGPLPAPLPSAFGLGVSGLLAVAAASRRRRA